MRELLICTTTPLTGLSDFKNIQGTKVTTLIADSPDYGTLAGARPDLWADENEVLTFIRSSFGAQLIAVIEAARAADIIIAELGTQVGHTLLGAMATSHVRGLRVGLTRKTEIGLVAMATCDVVVVPQGLPALIRTIAASGHPPVVSVVEGGSDVCAPSQPPA